MIEWLCILVSAIYSCNFFLPKAIMFWVVDSLIMRKYKQKDTLDINGSTETPRARRTEESQVRPRMSRVWDQTASLWHGLCASPQSCNIPSHCLDLGWWFMHVTDNPSKSNWLSVLVAEVNRRMSSGMICPCLTKSNITAYKVSLKYCPKWWQYLVRDGLAFALICVGLLERQAEAAGVPLHHLFQLSHF